MIGRFEALIVAEPRGSVRVVMQVAGLNQVAKRERPLFDSIAPAREWLATQV